MSPRRPASRSARTRAEHRHHAGLHVRRAAPVHAPVLDLGAPRVVRPVVLGRRRDDVDVAVEGQRPPAAAPAQHRGDVRAAGVVDQRRREARPAERRRPTRPAPARSTRSSSATSSCAARSLPSVLGARTSARSSSTWCSHPASTALRRSMPQRWHTPARDGLLPARREADRRRARHPRPAARVLRARGDAGHQRLLGAGRVPVRAGAEDRRAADGRRHDRGLRLPGDERDRGRAGEHGVGARRRQHGHVLRRPLEPRDAVDRDARLRGAEAALAAGDGRPRRDRRLRPDRARPRLRRRAAGELGAPRRRRFRPRRPQALDRQRHDRRRRDRVGARRGRPRRRLPGREGHAGLRRHGDDRQDRAARRLAGRHRAHRRPRAGREQAPRLPQLPRRRRRARAHPLHGRLARARHGARRLRGRARVREAARAVRQADRQLPARAGQAEPDAGRDHRDAAAVPAALRARRGRPPDRGHGVAGEDESRRQGARDRRHGARHPRRQRDPAGEPRRPPARRHGGDLHLRGHRLDPVADRGPRDHGPQRDY